MTPLLTRIKIYSFQKWICAAILGAWLAFGAQPVLISQQSIGSWNINAQGETKLAISPAPTSTSTRTPVPNFTATATPFLPSTPTNTPLPLPSSTPLPPPTTLPLVWSSSARPGAVPQTYISDTCQYFRQRWDPENSSPGTVVVPIMFHAIVPTAWNISRNNQMTAAQFQALVHEARDLGFETITTNQLVDFLLNNGRIPPLSMMLILDDNLLDTLTKYMLPVLEENNWTATLAYISGIDHATEWGTVERLAASGRIDVQAHGFLHNGRYIKGNIAAEIIQEELYKPIPMLQEHVGYRPSSYIWPGGDYNQLAVEMARQAGYQVGFTAYPRGPLMYNWVPLGADEQSMQDPLLVLPRFWSPRSEGVFEEAVQISLAAQAAAEQSREAEQNWLETYCPQE